MRILLGGLVGGSCLPKTRRELTWGTCKHKKKIAVFTICPHRRRLVLGCYVVGTMMHSNIVGSGWQTSACTRLVPNIASTVSR